MAVQAPTDTANIIELHKSIKKEWAQFSHVCDALPLTAGRTAYVLNSNIFFLLIRFLYVVVIVVLK